jgi:hypothetical protein
MRQSIDKAIYNKLVDHYRNMYTYKAQTFFVSYELFNFFCWVLEIEPRPLYILSRYPTTTSIPGQISHLVNFEVVSTHFLEIQTDFV